MPLVDMPSLIECPEWNYRSAADSSELLVQRNRALLLWIRTYPPQICEILSRDTRSWHRDFFAGLTPKGFAYYAGHYRGENFPCLKEREVGVPSDPTLGHAAVTVQLEMKAFANSLDDIFRTLKISWGAQEVLFSREQKVYRTVELAAAAFADFLHIHPYLDGNGHMGRLLVVAILARFGIYPARWPVDPRPPGPYGEALKEYRLGNRAKLELFILNCI